MIFNLFCVFIFIIINVRFYYDCNLRNVVEKYVLILVNLIFICMLDYMCIDIVFI